MSLYCERVRGASVFFSVIYSRNEPHGTAVVIVAGGLSIVTH